MMTTVRAFTAVCITLLWICNYNVSAANKSGEFVKLRCQTLFMSFDAVYEAVPKYCAPSLWLL